MSTYIASQQDSLPSFVNHCHNDDRIGARVGEVMQALAGIYDQPPTDAMNGVNLHSQTWLASWRVNPW